MTDYQAPLADMQFVFERICDLGALAALPGFEHVDPRMVEDLLGEAGRFMAEQVAPLNRIGDEVGSIRNVDGSVTTAPGFVDAYRAYTQAGWGAVSNNADHGGGGFPWLVGLAIQEMLTSANMAFSLGPLLTQGAIEAISVHGSESQQATFLPNMVSGNWTGTMNLTEPEAGSDVGALRTKAIPHGDGTYRLHGTKIFITYGEHDMAEQIIHLVLARTPDAPAGTRGISLFIVPKFLVNDDGTLGERNDVRCVSIEHKLGINASPTCVLAYGDGDGAVGYLLGAEHGGMAAMFTMMNRARVSVGLEGLAIGERAYQQALRYSQERLQGRALDGPKGVSSPIIEHADVRRMLLTMKATNEAMRCLCYSNAEAFDVATRHPDAGTRARADELAALLTPLSKAWCTDMGVEMASLNMQIHGGMGYIEETGAAQHFRDARIAPIYEGTNGIQAMDLVGRKLPMRGGAAMADHLKRIASTYLKLADRQEPEFAGVRRELSATLSAVKKATEWLIAHADNADDILAGATPYLRLVAVLTAGDLMARSALAAQQALDAKTGDEAFLRAKIVTARFFCEQIMPAHNGLVASITGGAAILREFDPA